MDFQYFPNVDNENRLKNKLYALIGDFPGESMEQTHKRRLAQFSRKQPA